VAIPNTNDKTAIALPNLATGDTIVCRYINNYCNLQDYDTVFVRINANQTPSVSITDPVGNGVCEYTNLRFSARPSETNGAPHYQWHVNNTPVGIDTNFYASVLLQAGDVVYCIIKADSACSTVDTARSNAVTIQTLQSITPHLSITVSPNDSVCSTSLPIFTAQSFTGNYDVRYQWYINNTQVGSDALIYAPSMPLDDSAMVVCKFTAVAGSCLTSPTLISNTIVMHVDTTEPQAPIIQQIGDSLIANINPVQWYINGTAIPDLTNGHIPIVVNGVYSATSTEGTCESMFSNFITINTAFVSEDQTKLHVYPNPSQGEVYVTVNHPTQLEVYNLIGNLVHTQYCTSGTQVLGIHHLSKGLYVIKSTINNSPLTTKLILN
jgi:hypothetical protein